MSRDLIRTHGGLDPLVKLIKTESTLKCKELLSAVTGAIWKCAQSVQNVLRFDELSTIPVLLQLVKDEDDEQESLLIILVLYVFYMRESKKKKGKSFPSITSCNVLLNHNPIPSVH